MTHGFDEHFRVLDRDLVEHLVPGSRELLDDVHLVGVEQAAAAEPGLVGEPDGVEHERVAFPAADRVPGVRVLERALRVVLAPVGRDHAQLRVPAAAVEPAPVDHRDVGSRSAKIRAGGPCRGIPSGRQVMTGSSRFVHMSSCWTLSQYSGLYSG